MAAGAEIVFWGSAYGGGNPLRSAALMHNYAIVSSGWGEFIGSNGVDVAPDRTMQPQPDATVRMATLDLDATMVNFVSAVAIAPPSPSVALYWASASLPAALPSRSFRLFSFLQNSGGGALPALIANGTLEVDWLDEATQSWRVVSKQPGIRAAEILEAHGVESLRHYRSKTRRYINARRQQQQPV